MTPSTARTLALVATSLGFGVVQLDVSVVNVAIAPIRSDFGGTISDVQWVVNAYTVVFAALILSAGAVGDRIGARRVFVAGFAVFTAASLACGLAPSLEALIAARMVQGLGAAALVPCSLSVLNHAFPDPQGRARAVGLWAAGASVGLSGGPVVGGVLTDLLSWRWIFLINLPLGLLGIVLTLRFADETSRSRDRALDPIGQLLGVVTLAALAGASIEGGRLGFADPLVLGGYAIAIAAAAGFVLAEARRRRPMLPLALFGSTAFSASSAIGLVINIAFYGLIFVLSLYFQQVRGYSALTAGLAFAPITAAVLVTNTNAGRIVARWGTGRTIATSAGVAAVALLGTLRVGDDSAYVAIVGQLAVVAAAIGVIVPAMTTALLGSVERSRSGVASGTLNTARQAGSVVGVAVFGSFAAGGIVAGLRLSLIVGAGLFVVAALLALPVAHVDSVPAETSDA